MHKEGNCHNQTLCGEWCGNSRLLPAKGSSTTAPSKKTPFIMNSHIIATFHALHCKRCSSGHPFYGQFDFGTFDLYVCSHLTLGTRLQSGEGGWPLDVGYQILGGKWNFLFYLSVNFYLIKNTKKVLFEQFSIDF